MTRALALVDGEHYPPVTADGIAAAEARGFQIVAAVMLGGTEKLSGPLSLGAIPVVDEGSATASLRHAIASYAPEAAIDISDDPVIDLAGRLRIAAICLASGVTYHGADFRFDVPRRDRLAKRPSIAVIGTGKRTGKTAVAAAVARILKREGVTPVLVAMGRGGPAEPRVVRGDERPPDAASLLAIARAGEHAASDVYEDAVMAGVAAVGARRAGAGIWGQPLTDTVGAAVEVANGLGGDVIILEGSGTAIPPVAADATILVAGGSSAGYLESGPGIYRLLLADLVVATMSDEPGAAARMTSVLTSLTHELARRVAYVGTVFRPTPLGSVAGRTMFLTTTAPQRVGDALRQHLEQVHGAQVTGISHRLGDRVGLEEDLQRARGSYEILATELKAAAVDVAVRRATEQGAEVVFVDNRPESVEGDLRSEVLRVAEAAKQRFEPSK
jgi:cyclic 2,3-diphosphoglycerate synthetase